MTPEEYRKKREEYFAQEQQQAAEQIQTVEAYECRIENGVEEIMHEGKWTKCFELPETHPGYSPF